MKKNILCLLIGLLAMVSCEKDIFSESDKLLSIEQFSPVKENGAMKLSGCVNLPAEFNRETAKIGFYVAEYDKYMAEYGFEIYKDEALEAYLMKDEYPDDYYSYMGKYIKDFYWIDKIQEDGSFELSFEMQIKQYICVAFALNIVGEDAQLIQSKPYFFTGETTPRLTLLHPVLHRFRLTFPQQDQVRKSVGLCWSFTDREPDLEDERVYVGDIFDENVIDVDLSERGSNYFDFGDNKVAYVRGFVLKTISDSFNGSTERVNYSNTIELRPEDVEFVINSKEDFKEFIESFYICTDSVNQKYDYRGEQWWRIFRGNIQFNYAVKKTDWLDYKKLENTSDSSYLHIPELHGVISGNGVIPSIGVVDESAVVKELSLLNCKTNWGLLENIQNLRLTTNYGRLKNLQNAIIYSNNSSIEGGQLIDIKEDNSGNVSKVNNVRINTNRGTLMDCDTIYVDNNAGLVQNCKEAITKEIQDDFNSNDDRFYMVGQNGSKGRIIDCTINNTDNNADMICETNYGYIENCLPNASCCRYNYGVIKNPYSEDDYSDNTDKEYAVNMFYGTWECDTIHRKVIQYGEVTSEYSFSENKRICFQEDSTYISYYYSSYSSEWYEDYASTWEYKNKKLILHQEYGNSIEYKVKELTDKQMVIVGTEIGKYYEEKYEYSFKKVTSSSR